MTRGFSCLLIWFLRSILADMTAHKIPQGFKYASYEVTIPRKLTPKYGGWEPQDVTYLLQLEGEGHMVHLRQKKGFVPKHFPVFTYSKEGELQVDYPFIRDDCFYRGFVQGKPSSLVTLSTCSGGLRGLFQLENGSYEIEPVQASPTFQHVVYRLEEKEGAVRMRCGLTEENQRRQKAMIQNVDNVAAQSVPETEWWSHIRYAEVAIVVEHERYVQFGKNESFITLQVLNVIHLGNSLYDPLSVQLTLVGLEIWSAKNLINISDSIGHTLGAFNKWRKVSLVKRLENDVGHLFAYKNFGITLGLAFVGTICSTDWASAVESFMTSSLFSFAVTFAHELGHVLGMSHDENYCTCSRKKCIMATYQANTDRFSNCSYKEYFAKRNTACLLIPPDPDKKIKFKYCGNEVVEHGEQCDCGSETQCESDPCCQSNCQFHSGTSCAFGQCCAKCQYLPARTLCRRQTGVCDLPEYCNGTSEECPEDLYVQDGAPCNDGAYCYHGNCTTHNGQCKMIFGNKATVASNACFEKMNVQGDRFGNCGLTHGAFRKCDAKNILCGRIQCENIDKLPSLEEHNTVIQTALSTRLCWGTDYHSGMGLADIGAVRDGTPCGTDMMCIDGQCTNVSLLKYDCDVRKCHNHGICNNHKHCHCDYGWTPPDCSKKGLGGSTDSGPPPPKKRVMSFSKGAIIAGTVFFLTSAAINIGLAVYYRKGLKQRFRRLRARYRPAESNLEETQQ
ncbi:disintegrin and metalloproteinase domain-containing protein 20-like [Elgaria multicarinata webbii]|uniref:disintegrin and metalloproteinase domain-containing protein 20-like n=1 Tax=Elgaria multicarinata webbii TaxID=159646 RepID=UPI002FCD4A33